MTLSSARPAPHPAGPSVITRKTSPQAGTPGVASHLIAAVAACGPSVIMDLAGLEGIGYGGLSVLLRVRRWTRRSGGDLPLAAPQQPVRRILEATGLIDVFAVNPNMEEAMNRARRQAVVTGRVAAAQCRSRISGPAH